MKLNLDDKYLQKEGPVFLTGIEAIVRLILDKQRRDVGEGQVNQTFVSGYEGSPLGGLDLKIVEEIELLNQLGRTVHQFGINEKTAASAMLGTQYAPGVDVDAFWYGKAHGAMWIPDEVWLANLAGTKGRGSMVLLSGEDHRSKSSVSPGSSDWVMRSSLVPIFYPASVEEILTLGMHAIALSRAIGVVTALKLVTPLCDGASTVEIEKSTPSIRVPEQEHPYQKSFNPIVMATGALPMQRELVERKLSLVEEYVRLNRINRIVDADVASDVGIVATGKSYTDVRQALDVMGLRVPVLHLSVTFPLEPQIIRDFSRGLRTIYVVEEPGPFVEDGVKAALWGTGVEEILGKSDEDGRPFIPAYGELDPETLASVLWPRLKSGAQQNSFLGIEQILEREYPSVPAVSPMSCGGCPYNSFRDLKEKPGGAIGCSSIRAVEAYDDGVLYIPTMGAGGSIYSGTASFNGNRHIFQYLGDGSYFHSGRGAIQSCVQSDVNITFLILYNGAVSLTGGQPPGGQRSVEEVCQELVALGVKKVGVVSEEASRYRDLQLPRVDVYPLECHSEALDAFKKEQGTTAIVLDKECAKERSRRMRRQGVNPSSYVLINQMICEGCGDCYTQSEGCAALYNVETEFGDKTGIRQSDCTQDGLCIDGDCPSFVTVTPSNGTGLRRRLPESLEDLPEPDKQPFENDYTIFAVGRGGTGVVTVSHVVAYAAMIEGKHVHLSNNTGLAQKGGPVEAPIVMSEKEQPVFNRLVPGSSHLYLGFDLLRAADPTCLKFVSRERSVAVVSTTRVASAGLNRHPDRKFPDPELLADVIDRYTRKSANVYLDTYWLAERLFADTLYANVILLGAAYQTGRVPLEAASIETALLLGGKAVEKNVQAFRWGRLAVVDPVRVEATLGRQWLGDDEVIEANRQSLQAMPASLALYEEALDSVPIEAEGRRELSVRVAELCAYQDERYARQYVDFVRGVWGVERGFPDRGARLTRAVIRELYKLMAYKDEYEVARLAVDRRFEDSVRDRFEGDLRISYRLHPPSLRWLGLGKMSFGPWSRPLLSLLARMKGFRGTRLDLFGRASCRQLERELIDWYRDMIEEVLTCLTEGNYDVAARIAEAPEGIRGYEGIKEKSAAAVRAETERLLQTFRS